MTLTIGERFVGESSGAVAVYLVRNSDIGIGFVYLNDSAFEPGEIVKFKDSKVTGTVTIVNTGSSNITQNFHFPDRTVRFISMEYLISVEKQMLMFHLVD